MIGYDTHCHLQEEGLEVQQDSVLARARAAGVERMVCCGTSESDWPGVQRVVRASEAVIAGFGLHPWFITRRGEKWFERLKALLLKYPSSIVGEIGLDHALDAETFDAQHESFERQLDLAFSLDRPVSIHCRRAWGDMLAVLSPRMPFPSPCVFHSYSGPLDHIAPLTAAGGYISFSGTITLSGNKRGHANVKRVPEDRLLVETDAPALPPVINGVRSYESPNEPANLIHVIKKLAELRGVLPAEMADLTTRNAQRVFGQPVTGRVRMGEAE